MQKDRRAQRKMGVRDLCIGFAIYKVCLLEPYLNSKIYFTADAIIFVVLISYD